jgi:DNA invertase Pin-like site-specific DNA recombinase
MTKRHRRADRAKNAVNYVRWSDRPNAEFCASAQVQFESVRAYCQSQRWRIIGEFDECDEDDSDDDRKRKRKRKHGVSGTSTKDRPKLAAAVALAKAHRAVLVVYKLDRFARNTEDTLRLVRELRERGAEICFVHDKIDTSGPIGNFFLTILAAVAQYEAATIAQRTSDAMRSYQAKGRRMTRIDMLPYGWQCDEAGPPLVRTGKDGVVVSELPARMVKHPGEQQTIKKIRQLRRYMVYRCRDRKLRCRDRESLRAATPEDVAEAAKSANGVFLATTKSGANEECYIDRLGPRRINRILNDDPGLLATSRAGRWHLTTVRRLLEKIDETPDSEAKAVEQLRRENPTQESVAP